MNLYEVSQSILTALAAVEVEADQYAAENLGEVNENLEARLEALKMSRDDLLDNLTRYYKNNSAEAEAYALEIERLGKLMDSAKKKADRIAAIIEMTLPKEEKITLSCGKLSWRPSKKVIVDNENLLPPEAFNIVPESKKVSLLAVKSLIAENKLPENAAHIQENFTLQIK